MKIIVLNGSPKGDVSVTMHYVRYIQKYLPDHEFKFINISQRIHKITKDEKSFLDIMNDIRSADGVLWAFPVYVCLVPGQYKRFIEMIFEKNAADAFRDKYTAVLTTSVHFYDHTAHNYMHAVCDDLGMKYAGFYSAEMYDLMKDSERKRLLLFAGDIISSIKDQVSTNRTYHPSDRNHISYIPGSSMQRYDLEGRKLLIITDAKDDQSNLTRMVERFRSAFTEGTEIVNLHDINIRGGCLGCCQCGYDNTCAYEGKDGFTEFYNTKVRQADILIFAGSIKDRFLSSRWKTYFDRAFFNTHIPTLIGRQIGFIISGPLSQNHNLAEILKAYGEWQQSNLVDIVTDEYDDSSMIDSLLQRMAERCLRFSGSGYRKTMTFRGVAGMKIFRDEVWGNLRFVFQADHRYYREHGFYNFPQYNAKARIRNFLMILLTGIPSFRREFIRKIKDEMAKPLTRVLESK